MSTKYWPSTLSRDEFARVLGIEPVRLKEWAGRRVIVPVEHERCPAASVKKLALDVLEGGEQGVRALLLAFWRRAPA